MCKSSPVRAQEGQVPLPGLSAPPPPPRFPLSLAAVIEARRPRQEGELFVLPLEQPFAAAVVVQGLQEQELQEQQDLKMEEEALRIY